MKKVLIIILLSILTVVVLIGASFNESVNLNEDVLRIHIRANSNLECDQKVKYEIKDKVVDYLIPLLINVETKQDVQQIILSNEKNIENMVDDYLKSQGFNYTSNIKINNEEFPSRSYNGVVLKSGFYDAVIVELGSASGNNWWCVIYPPLCFTEYSNENYKKVVYKSKIMEIIDKIFKRGSL